MKTIIELASDSGFKTDDKLVLSDDGMTTITYRLELFAKLIRREMCLEMSKKVEAMPFGDTSASFAQWIRNEHEKIG